MDEREKLLEQDKETHAGMVWYRPCNGTEGYMFEERCEECEHFIDYSENEKMPTMQPPFVCCELGILDKIQLTGFEDEPHECFWHKSDEILRKDGDEVHCPAICLKFEQRMPTDA